MTRKDYIAIAAALRECRDAYSSVIARQVVEDAANHIAAALRDDNAAFNTARFLTAVRSEAIAEALHN